MTNTQKHLEFYGIILAADNTTTDFTGANAITNLFKITEKITIQTGEIGTKNVEIMVPLKYVSNFLRTLEMPFRLKTVIVTTDVEDQAETF